MGGGKSIVIMVQDSAGTTHACSLKPKVLDYMAPALCVSHPLAVNCDVIVLGRRAPATLLISLCL